MIVRLLSVAVYVLCGTIAPTLARPASRGAPEYTASVQPGERVPLKTFALEDVQGLFGGQSIWAAEDRTAYVQFVGHRAGGGPLWESRYKTALTPEQWAEVERLVGTHHLLTAKTSTRPGVPDEARPAITVVTRAGTTVTVAKWANDKHRDFDPVYSYLLDLCHGKGELVHEGEYDWKWRPPGFDKPR